LLFGNNQIERIAKMKRAITTPKTAIVENVYKSKVNG
jgi:hypothetical protein